MLNKINSTQKADIRFFFIYEIKERNVYLLIDSSLDEHFVWNYVCHFYV